jgi:hypothetical protein
VLGSKISGTHRCAAEDPILLGCGTVIRCIVSDILKDHRTFTSKVKQSTKKKALRSLKTPGTKYPTTKHHILHEMNIHKCWTLENNFDDCLIIVHFITIFLFYYYMSNDVSKVNNNIVNDSSQVI